MHVFYGLQNKTSWSQPTNIIRFKAVNTNFAIK